MIGKQTPIIHHLTMKNTIGCVTANPWKGISRCIGTNISDIGLYNKFIADMILFFPHIAHGRYTSAEFMPDNHGVCRNICRNLAMIGSIRYGL